MKGSGRTDDDDGALRILEQIIKLPGAGHQAIEIHLDHLVEIFGFKLRPLVHHHALRADENIQPVELLAELFNVSIIGGIDLMIVEAVEIRSIGFVIIIFAGAGAGDMDLGATAAKGLRRGIADAARAADDTDGFTTIVEGRVDHDLLLCN